MNIARTIKSENKNGAQFVKKIETKENGLCLIEIKCKYCGKHHTMWLNHYYRGSNPCRCQTEVLNERLHSIWINMKTRCFNSNIPEYDIYGGRGITVCSEWLQYKSFESWAMNNGYEDNLTIDRIDVNGDYCPENCRWVDDIVQANNKRDTIKFIINQQQISFKKLCEMYELNYKTEHTYYLRHGYNNLITRLIDKTHQIINSFNYKKDYKLPFLF